MSPVRFPLAVTVVLVCAAIIGVAPASATQTRLCTPNPLTNNGCPTSHAETTSDVTLTVPNFILTSSIASVTCHAHLKWQTTVATGTPLVLHFSVYLFDNCKTSSGTNCTLTAVNLPYSVAIQASTAKVTDPTGAGFEAKCGFLINCTFSSTETDLKVSNGSPTTFTAAQVKMTRSGGFCPETAELHGTYSVVSPSGLTVI